MNCHRCLVSSMLIPCAALLAGFAAQPQTPSPSKPKVSPPAMKPDSKPSTPASKGDPKEAKPSEGKESPYVLNYKMKLIDGTEEDLSAYKGKVVVMVNVASKCGYTPQYEGLQKLYADDKERGLVILGFPADNFGHQEPGDSTEIKKTCFDTYHVTFPMFEKISVKGEDAHPLYKQLAAQPAPIGGEPKWNFTKFVVDRQGNVVARFDAKKSAGGSRADLEPEFVKKVEELLGGKPKKVEEKKQAPTSGS
jgi:glutathione peroxidase